MKLSFVFFFDEKKLQKRKKCEKEIQLLVIYLAALKEKLKTYSYNTVLCFPLTGNLIFTLYSYEFIFVELICAKSNDRVTSPNLYRDNHE